MKKKQEFEPMNKWRIKRYSSNAWEVRQMRRNKDTGAIEYGDAKYPGNIQAAAVHLLDIAMQNEAFDISPNAVSVYADRVTEVFNAAAARVVSALKPFENGKTELVLDLEEVEPMA